MPDDLAPIFDDWQAAWPRALEAWSKFTRLRPARFCRSAAEVRREGLSGSFAMIRLVDQAVVIDLPAVRACGVQDFAVEVLAHEIGHHILAPATLTDHARSIARIRRALPTLEAQAPMVANLYTDLLINDRLQRGAGLRMAEVYRALAKSENKAAPGTVWRLYLRIYEILWSLERGALGGGLTDGALEGDAWLGARLVRSYAREWLDGASRFAALLLPHLVQDQEAAERCSIWLDTRQAGADGEVCGLTEEEAGESVIVHPANDPAISGANDEAAPPQECEAHAPARGQARQPFEYGEILRAAGVDLSDHDIAVRYYRERARPHLVPFPSRALPESVDPLPEGLEPWDIGQPLDRVDWLHSVLQSPHVIPGFTTVQRAWGTSAGTPPERLPFDLDLYVDSSGSMPHPQRLISYPALAGAILCLSALRAGARVQATLWSGKNQVTTTDGFVRDEIALLRVLTGYFGGGTQFPIHRLRDTYAARRTDSRPAHVLVVSDDGAATIFDRDERGESGWKVVAEALARARGGGTMALNLAEDWEIRGAAPAQSRGAWYQGAAATLLRAREEQGWHIDRLASLENLVAFAREFSHRHYAAGPLAASQ